jgi:tRNA dimethylallyltransferase
MLRQNIAARVDGMFAAGLENEVRNLVEAHGWCDIFMQTIGYKEFKNYLDGLETLEQVRAAIIRNTIAYAKRQRTWFRRNSAIIYPSNQEQSVDLITTWLNK